MFGRNNSPVGPVWICYVCLLNGSSVLEGRRFLSIQFMNESSETKGAVAETFGSIGSLANGRTTWNADGTALSIGDREYLINDCTKDFLKITDIQDRTAYFFIAQQSRSFNPF